MCFNFNFLGDGMGIQTQTMARIYKGEIQLYK